MWVRDHTQNNNSYDLYNCIPGTRISQKNISVKMFVYCILEIYCLLVNDIINTLHYTSYCVGNNCNNTHINYCSGVKNLFNSISIGCFAQMF